MNENSLQSLVQNHVVLLKRNVQIEMENWIRAYQEKFMMIAYGIVRDYYLAEDCVQETFIKAGLNYENLIQKNNVYPWIHRILVNECKSQLRSKWMKGVLKPGNAPEGCFFDEYPSLRAELHTIIHQLPLTTRMPILLYYFGDTQISDIAKALNIKESTCRVRLHRGRNLLKKYLS